MLVRVCKQADTCHEFAWVLIQSSMMFVRVCKRDDTCWILPWWSYIVYSAESQTVILSSKIQKIFVGYFDPTNIICYNRNNNCLLLLNGYIAQNKTTTAKAPQHPSASSISVHRTHFFKHDMCSTGVQRSSWNSHHNLLWTGVFLECWWVCAVVQTSTRFPQGKPRLTPLDCHQHMLRFIWTVGGYGTILWVGVFSRSNLNPISTRKTKADTTGFPSTHVWLFILTTRI